MTPVMAGTVTMALMALAPWITLEYDHGPWEIHGASRKRLHFAVEHHHLW